MKRMKKRKPTTVLIVPPFGVHRNLWLYQIEPGFCMLLPKQRKKVAAIVRSLLRELQR